MKAIRSALQSHRHRALGLAVLVGGFSLAAFANAGGGNMVSVFRGADGAECWVDLNAGGGSWEDGGVITTSGNDAKEEVAAAQDETRLGKFVGIRPENVARGKYKQCDRKGWEGFGK